jgi:D-glycero-D-manno-heptose 1,7-bisphosphate phosphatase
MKTPFVIFDRDGTFIEHVHYLAYPNLVKFKEGIIPSLISLQNNGFKFGIITNQSIIGRGLADYQTVNKINNKIT